jgi:LacI family transcriptional regulator
VAGIREVAARSGVSIATVSRVFNGSPRVSEATRQRVLAGARELDYVPSAAARTLVRRRSQLIGVVLDTGGHAELQHPFFQDVLVGVKAAVGGLGYDLLLFANERHTYLGRALQHRVDGLVMLSVDAHDPDVARIVEAELPAVAVDLKLAGAKAGWVSSDNAGGAHAAVRHLRERGHRRIATIAGPGTHLPGVERLEGFRAAVGRIRKSYVEHGDFYAESGYSAARRLLSLRDPPTAIFAASDLMAIGAVQAAREAGLRVPGDLAVVGFDDAAVAAAADPPLTTLRQDKAGLGRAAGAAVVRLVEEPGAAPPALRLPVQLVVRGST